MGQSKERDINPAFTNVKISVFYEASFVHFDQRQARSRTPFTTSASERWVLPLDTGCCSMDDCGCQGPSRIEGFSTAAVPLSKLMVILAGLIHYYYTLQLPLLLVQLLLIQLEVECIAGRLLQDTARTSIRWTARLSWWHRA